MLATFCIRLGFGLLASLLLLLAYQINPRFYRAHFLTALGLCAGALVLISGYDDAILWWLLLAATVVCAVGWMSWSIEKNPAGRSLIVVGTLLAGVALGVLSMQRDSAYLDLMPANDFSSAILLGTATTAMLLGHSYLIAPTMSIQPLVNLLFALGGAILVRAGIALYSMWLWTEQPGASNLDTVVVLWLVARWLFGIILPLVLGWMAWETAKIRSTQSATGILYVVVIFCFIGELTSQLLMAKTQLMM